MVKLASCQLAMAWDGGKGEFCTQSHGDAACGLVLHFVDFTQKVSTNSANSAIFAPIKQAHTACFIRAGLS